MNTVLGRRVDPAARVEPRWVGGAAGSRSTAWRSAMGPTYWLYAAWLVALAATLGSLFFGEVMGLPPCTLCWYQRICMFPLALLLPVGIVLRDARVTWYCLPLVALGLAIAAYHNLIDYGVVPERLAPCGQGVSCAARPIAWFGFVTIPALALAAFAVIGACLLASAAGSRRSRA